MATPGEYCHDPSDIRLKFSHDLLSPVFDRSYAHDHAGRISEALSGAEARNEGTTNNRPYKQTFVYDADGNLTDSNSVDYTIDAAAQTQRFVSLTPIEPPPGQPILDEYAVTLDVTQSFDGNGMAVKKIAVNTVHGGQGGDQTTTHTTYLLRSSALGGKVVSEIGSESEQRSFVYLGSSVLAVQQRSNQTVMWEHRDVGNGSVRLSSSNGTVATVGNAELDPLGGDAGLSAPVTETPSPAQYWKFSSYPGLGGPTTSMNCIMDFIPTPCSEVGRALNAGIADRCKNDNCGPRIVPIHSDGTIIGEGLAPLTRDPNSGRLGYAHIYAGGRPVNNAPLSNTPPVLRQPGSNRSPGNLRDEDDFTFADGPQNSDFDIPGITKLVDLELADSDCVKFAETVLNQLSKGKGGSLAEVFKAFLNQPKPHSLFTRTPPRGSFGEASVIGKMKDSTAALFLRRASDQVKHDAHNVIAELFHLVGNGYSDEQLARALRKTEYAADAPRVMAPSANIFDPGYVPGDWPKHKGYSVYFHSIQKLHCGLIPANYRN